MYLSAMPRAAEEEVAERAANRAPVQSRREVGTVLPCNRAFWVTIIAGDFRSPTALFESDEHILDSFFDTAPVCPCLITIHRRLLVMLSRYQTYFCLV